MRKILLIVLILSALVAIGLWGDSYRDCCVSSEFAGSRANSTTKNASEFDELRRFEADLRQGLNQEGRCRMWEVNPGRGFCVATDAGRFKLAYIDLHAAPSNLTKFFGAPPGFHLFRASSAVGASTVSLPGALRRQLRTMGMGVAYGVEVPFWFIVSLLLAYPAIAFVRGPYRRRRRWALGYCRHCNYDLTGLEEPVCPECGQAFNLEQAARNRERVREAARRAVQWLRRCRASRWRRHSTLCCWGGVVLTAGLWALGYWRVSCQVGAFCIAPAWGNINLYYTSAADRSPEQTRMDSSRCPASALWT